MLCKIGWAERFCWTDASWDVHNKMADDACHSLSPFTVPLAFATWFGESGRHIANETPLHSLRRVCRRKCTAISLLDQDTRSLGACLFACLFMSVCANVFVRAARPWQRVCNCLHPHFSMSQGSSCLRNGGTAAQHHDDVAQRNSGWRRSLRCV